MHPKKDSPGDLRPAAQGVSSPGLEDSILGVDLLQCLALQEISLAALLLCRLVEGLLYHNLLCALRDHHHAVVIAHDEVARLYVDTARFHWLVIPDHASPARRVEGGDGRGEDREFQLEDLLDVPHAAVYDGAVGASALGGCAHELTPGRVPERCIGIGHDYVPGLQAVHELDLLLVWIGVGSVDVHPGDRPGAPHQRKVLAEGPDP